MNESTTSKAPRNTAGAIAKAGAAKPAKPVEGATLKSYISRMKPEIAKALPSHIPLDRFVRILYSAVSANPVLAKCTPDSFMAAFMGIAQMGLEANTGLGQAYIIPYYNKKERRYEAQLQLGVKGILTLAYNSGQVSSVQVHEVYEADTFEYSFGLHPDLKHIPARTNRGEVTDYYAVINLVGGGYIFEVMSKEDVIAHAKRYSQSFEKESSPWHGSGFDSMAKKTVLKRALKYAPVSASLMRDISADETIKTEISEDMSEIAGSYIVEESTGEVVAEVPQEEAEQVQMEASDDSK